MRLALRAHAPDEGRTRSVIDERLLNAVVAGELGEGVLVKITKIDCHALLVIDCHALLVKEMTAWQSQRW
jgi:hypothetical protein